MEYEAVIGLEVHAEMQTRSKMFCGCPVVDATRAEPNTAVCPICSGMPGVLPVVNRQAVEYALRVALALECEIARTSLFARKNYFYPDLPKGYQISQYEYPLAQRGRLVISTAQGEQTVRIRRVHLEEDTGKLTHVEREGESFSLVDLNRSGIALLEIVTEPDLHSPEAVRAYAETLRSILRYTGANSGDMEKGVMRIEPNVSVRPAGSDRLGTRTEVKNLNSFRALERAVAYEIQRQIALLERGEPVIQQTVGWDESTGSTFPQRSKEEAHDYRYFPEPDLPPLVVETEWVEAVRAELPELPRARMQRFRNDYGLARADAAVLVQEKAVADYFEEVLACTPGLAPRSAAAWITGELFAWMKIRGEEIDALRVRPAQLGALIEMTARGEINPGTAKSVLADMLRSGRDAAAIVAEKGLTQVSDAGLISEMVRQVLADSPSEVNSYLAGKETLANWFFGQVMKRASGQGNPAVIRAELERQLAGLKEQAGGSDSTS